MKTLSITSVTVVSSAVTINATWADETFTQPHQQVSIAEQPAANPFWSRLFRLTDQAVFVLRTGQNTVAMLIDELAKVAVALEPGLSWPPRFSTQPPSGSVAAGANITLTSVHDATDEIAATYAWSRSTDGGATWTAITGGSAPSDGATYSNYTTVALTITAAVLGMNGYVYKCTATNAAGATDSSLAVLTVTGAAPTISGQPSNESCVHNSTTATFALTATGSSLAYQWQVSINGTTGWTNITDSTLGNPGPYSGSATASLVVTPTTTGQTGYSYRCIVSNGSGSVTSSVKVLTVT